MGKALKPFIIINLILTGVSIYLGWLIYQDREIMKARKIVREATLRTVAENLMMHKHIDPTTGGNPIDKFAAVAAYVGKSDLELKGIEDYWSALQRMDKFVQARQVHLEATENNLVQMRQEIDRQKGVLDGLLAQRKTAIERREELIASINALVADKKEADREADTLRGQKATLEGEVAALNTQIGDLNDRIAELQQNLEETTTDFETKSDQYQRCKGRADARRNKGFAGKSATILQVNKDWRYIVINVGGRDELPVNAVAHVHRGKTYLALAEVIRVETNVAIAQLLPETIVDGANIKPGDKVF